LISYTGLQSERASQRTDVLHMPVINLNNAGKSGARSLSNVTHVNDHRQTRTVNTYGRTKSTLVDPTTEPYRYRGYSLTSNNDDQIEYEQKLKQIKKDPSAISAGENSSSASDLDNTYDDEYGDNLKIERRPSLLNDGARRLLMLGTIRPSKTFYKNLPQADADHLMEYFRRMKTTNQRVTSEEINEELATKIVEYKPKICKFGNIQIFI
jgi:hypothetical protein